MCSQNSEIVTHIKRGILRRTGILANSIPFQNRILLLKERIRSHWERFFSFERSLLWYGLTLGDFAIMCSIFITHMVNCVMGATPVAEMRKNDGQLIQMQDKDIYPLCLMYTKIFFWMFRFSK